MTEDGGRVELLSDLDRPAGWVLLAGGVPQSYVDLGDPLHLELGYVRRIGHVIDLAAPAGEPLRVLHLGAGGLTLARYVAATRPGSRQLAVEADPAVAALVRRRLPLARPGQSPGEYPVPGRITVRVGDARTALERLPAGSFDVLINDVFTGARTPAHVTSAEFTATAARALAPSGVYAVNISDGPPLAHARGRVAAVRAVLGHACLMGEPDVLAGREFGNLIAVAAGHAMPVAELAARAAADPYPATVLDGPALQEFIAGAEPITDARAERSPAPPPDPLA